MNLVKKKKVKKQIAEIMSGNEHGKLIIDSIIEKYHIEDLQDLESLTSLKGQLDADNAVMQSMLDGMNSK